MSNIVISPIKIRAPVSARRTSAAKNILRKSEQLQLVEFNPQIHLEELTELLKKDTDEEVRRQFMYPAQKSGRDQVSLDNVRRIIVHLRLRNQHAIALRIVVKTSYSSEIAVGHAQIVKTHSTDDMANIAKFYISKMFRKRGYEQKALVSVVLRAFEFFNVQKVLVSCFESNQYFIKLLMQLGFRLSKAFSKSIIEQKRYFLVLNRQEFEYNVTLNKDKIIDGQPHYMKKPPTRGLSQTKRRPPQPKSLSDVRIKLPPIKYPITEFNLQSIKHVSFKLPQKVGGASSLDIATTADTSKRSKQVVVSTGRTSMNGEQHSVTFSASPQISHNEEQARKIVLLAPFFSPPKTRIQSQYPQYYKNSSAVTNSDKNETKSSLPPRTDILEYMNQIKVSKSMPKSYVKQYMSRKAGNRESDRLSPRSKADSSDLERFTSVNLRFSNLPHQVHLSTRGSQEMLPSLDGSSRRGELDRNFSPAPDSYAGWQLPQSITPVLESLSAKH